MILKISKEIILIASLIFFAFGLRKLHEHVGYPWEDILIGFSIIVFILILFWRDKILAFILSFIVSLFLGAMIYFGFQDWKNIYNSLIILSIFLFATLWYRSEV